MDNLSGTLCHYTTPDAAFQHIIPWGRLRMSPYARMRDPLENRELTFRAAEGSDDREAHGQLYERIRESVRRIRDRMLILSFTIDAMDRYADSDLPFMRAWARARMWEQYADNHAGVCIAFDRERALGHMEAQLNQLGSVGRGRVVYTPRGFSDTQASTLMLDRFCDDFSQKVAAFVVENEHDLFFTKTLDWQSESALSCSRFSGR